MTPESAILIAGSFGHGNTGDEAILSVVVSRLRETRPSVRLFVVGGALESIAARHDIDPVPWNDWSGIAELVPSVDMVLLAGGGLFFDYGTFDPAALLRNAAPDLAHFGGFPVLAHLLRKPLAILGCGVGPLLSPLGRRMTRFSFRTAARASVRDEDSRALLLRIGAGPVAVTADPAFALEPASSESVDAIFTTANVDASRPLIAVAPREGNEFGTGWEGHLARAVDLFARREGAQVVVLPFHSGQDDAVAERLRARLEGHRAVVLGGLSPEETAGVIGRCDLVVAMRFHSLVFAVSGGTPAAALSYAPKVRSLLRGVGHEELCVDVPDAPLLANLLEVAWNRRTELSKHFADAGRRMRAAAEADIDALAAAAGSVPQPDRALSETDRDLFQEFLGRVVSSRLDDIRARDAALGDVGPLREEIRDLRIRLAEEAETIRRLDAGARD